MQRGQHWLKRTAITSTKTFFQLFLNFLFAAKSKHECFHSGKINPYCTTETYFLLLLCSIVNYMFTSMLLAFYFLLLSRIKQYGLQIQ